MLFGKTIYKTQKLAMQIAILNWQAKEMKRLMKKSFPNLERLEVH